MKSTNEAPVARAQILIRKPIAQVFAAFVDPTITARFWFSHGSAPLEPGARVRWDWEMYGIGTDVVVRAIERDARILVEWNGPDRTSEVEWRFVAHGPDRTFVTVENRGFRGERDAVMTEALTSTQGFTFVLAGAKIFLEHGIDPRFVVDHAPDQLVPAWRRAS